MPSNDVRDVGGLLNSMSKVLSGCAGQSVRYSIRSRFIGIRECPYCNSGKCTPQSTRILWKFAVSQLFRGDAGPFMLSSKCLHEGALQIMMAT